MLPPTDLRKLAAAIQVELFAAQRGAVPVARSRSVLAFGNEGYGPMAREAVEVARALLTAGGYALGPVMTGGEDGYTWAFEAVPPPCGLGPPVDVVTGFVWAGWAATRSGDPLSPPTEAASSDLQAALATQVCSGFDADAVLAG
ncbi:hypothetical protein [Limnoglobus roseus]|uniref:Uncharacterized protein n=1 Tax=Limnoglobus roseus TaxID=2598579 RepID=A0A5C1AHH2_9BACT|nr:hypothetical protein [Limnoglobus roseus]QEL17703.1 hypothetical protein PX52LOC_04702 [Limnoglobus roseus]